MLTDPGMTTDQARALGDWVAAQGPEPDRHLRHPRPRRSLVRRRAAGGTVRGPCRRHRGNDRADARQRRDAAVALGQGVLGHPADAGHRGDGPGQPLHARRTRPRDRRGRPHRQRRHQRPARPGSRAGRRRRRDLQRRPHVSRRRAWSSAASGRGGPRSTRSRPSSPGTSSPATRTSSSTTTPSGRSRRPGNTSTTPTSSCGPRTPPSTSSTPRSSGTRTISGRTVLWAGASALYGVREHPEEDVGQIMLDSWL